MSTPLLALRHRAGDELDAVDARDGAPHGRHLRPAGTTTSVGALAPGGKLLLRRSWPSTDSTFVR